jgi:isochorismate synthase
LAEKQNKVTVTIVVTVASDVLVTQPYSIKAGEIWHIKTDISGRLNVHESLKKIIEILSYTSGLRVT